MNKQQITNSNYIIYLNNNYHYFVEFKNNKVITTKNIHRATALSSFECANIARKLIRLNYKVFRLNLKNNNISEILLINHMIKYNNINKLQENINKGDNMKIGDKVKTKENEEGQVTGVYDKVSRVKMIDNDSIRYFENDELALLNEESGAMHGHSSELEKHIRDTSSNYHHKIKSMQDIHDVACDICGNCINKIILREILKFRSFSLSKVSYKTEDLFFIELRFEDNHYEQIAIDEMMYEDLLLILKS